ncbi:MAG: hypothetical protein VR78_03740 [Hoeflea sp. BRH_c9]|nr:MAG: hypothetical protein VR78_03740 [Hoeflea sp. BRH_c9]
MSESLVKGLPMFVFLLIYLLIDIFGSIVLFTRLEPFYSVFIYHSGITLPVNLDDEQMLMFWLVAIGSPAIMFAAFFAAFQAVSRRFDQTFPVKRDYDPPFWSTVLLFAVLAYFGAYSLVRADGLHSLWTWANYADLVEARWSLFAKLSFFEFTNLYQFIPVVAIVALLVGIKHGGIARIVGIGCAVACLFVGILIFQKKATLTAILMIAFALIIYSYLFDSKRVARLIGLAGASFLIIMVCFFAASVVPTLMGHQSTIGNASNTAQQLDFVKKWRDQLEAREAASRSEREKLTDPAHEAKARSGATHEAEARSGAAQSTDKPSISEREILAARVKELVAQNPAKNNLFLATTVGLTMRNSVPAVYYIATFPERHPFYRLDLGQDILGFGAMPDDNHVVWSQMYPEMPGVVAAPYNFVLYSQGGLAISYMMSAVIGLAVGLIWALVLKARGSIALRAAFGSVVVVGTMHLALDALRNTIIVSYGFAWGLVPLLVLLIAGGVTDRLRRTGKEAIAVGD